jgi:hypothetical protein
MENRSAVAESLIGILSDDIIILVTYEAHFHLSGRVNKQNFRYWKEKSVAAPSTTSSHYKCDCFVCHVANFGVIGPYFFEDEDCQVRLLHSLL